MTGNQMCPPLKKRRLANYRYLSPTPSELPELNMVPDDDQELMNDNYAEEEGYYVYPDPEASQVAW
jgi:hypothetical protein